MSYSPLYCGTRTTLQHLAILTKGKQLIINIDVILLHENKLKVQQPQAQEVIQSFASTAHIGTTRLLFRNFKSFNVSRIFARTKLVNTYK